MRRNFFVATVSIAQMSSTKTYSIPAALKKITKAFGTEFIYDAELLKEKRLPIIWIISVPKPWKKF